MAKFGRYDPRNKKSGRNKQHSIYKDIRIKMSEDRSKKKNWTEVSWDNELESEEVSDGYEDESI